MNIETIIKEADVRIPNAFSTAQKVDWLNEVNYEFFDVVKIPAAVTIAVDGSNDTFTVPNDLREKNVRKVVVGSNYYRSMIYEDITAAFNFFTVDEKNHNMIFSPQPPAGNAVIVYDKMGVTPFYVGVLSTEPDAPSEYHWLYILGLCTRIAKAMNDVVLANNYDTDYKTNLGGWLSRTF